MSSHLDFYNTLRESKKSITFVCGNQEKIKQYQQWFALFPSYELKIFDLDLPELQGIPEEIAINKCETASKHIQGPIFIEDNSLGFTALGELPGPYIKWFLQSCPTSTLHRMLHDFEDKSGVYHSFLCYSNGGGSVQVFSTSVQGTIVAPRGKGYGWGEIFVPAGFDKTYAEMTQEEKSVFSAKKQNLDKLFAWLATK